MHAKRECACNVRFGGKLVDKVERFECFVVRENGEILDDAAVGCGVSGDRIAEVAGKGERKVL